VEEANGITRVRTPGNPGVRSYSYATTFCTEPRRSRRVSPRAAVELARYARRTSSSGNSFVQ